MQQHEQYTATIRVATPNRYLDATGEPPIPSLSDCSAEQLIETGELGDYAVAWWRNQRQRDLAMAAWAAAPARMVKRPAAPPIRPPYRRSQPGRSAPDGEIAPC